VREPSAPPAKSPASLGSTGFGGAVVVDVVEGAVVGAVEEVGDVVDGGAAVGAAAWAVPGVAGTVGRDAV